MAKGDWVSIGLWKPQKKKAYAMSGKDKGGTYWSLYKNHNRTDENNQPHYYISFRKEDLFAVAEMFREMADEALEKERENQPPPTEDDVPF
jgi:hypothetical protein